MTLLSQADTRISDFLPVFNEAGVDVAFLVPTETGHAKSIMDATTPVRTMLAERGIHDYEAQLQGPEHKARIRSFIVTAHENIPTMASLYRPVTKNGDPRIWFDGLKKYCQPWNTLAVIGSEDNQLYVFNLSKSEIAGSLLDGQGFAFNTLNEICATKLSTIESELLERLRIIANNGPTPAVNNGDSAVGNTLEALLGIKSNSLTTPDYKGIELKSWRDRANKSFKNRSTLFTQVPDQGMTYRKIVETFGKQQVARGQTEPRLQIYETFSTNRVNAYGLTLALDEPGEQLLLVDDQTGANISGWSLELLKQRLKTKHPTTFWISASVTIEGHNEFFSYQKAVITRRPNPELIAPLLQEGIITLDLAGHFGKDGKFRNHGVLFKIHKFDLPKLFQNPQVFDLVDGSKFGLSLDESFFGANN